MRRTCHGILNGRRWSRRESAEPALSAIEVIEFPCFFSSLEKSPESSDTQTDGEIAQAQTSERASRNEIEKKKKKKNALPRLPIRREREREVKEEE
jgi:hypothetical protein